MDYINILKKSILSIVESDIGVEDYRKVKDIAIKVLYLIKKYKAIQLKKYQKKIRKKENTLQ